MTKSLSQRLLGGTSKAVLFAAAIGAAGFMLAPQAARADIISVAVSETAAPTASATAVYSANSPISYNGTTTNFSYTVTASGTPSQPEPNLSTTDVDTQSNTSGTHTIWVAITESGITTPSGPYFLSGFTAQKVSAAGTTTIDPVYETTLVSATNASFTGTQLATTTFVTQTTPQSASSTNAANFTGTYSETALYEITTTGVGQTADLTITFTPVPEPMSLTLFGSALVGLGAMRRRRKAKQQA